MLRLSGAVVLAVFLITDTAYAEDIAGHPRIVDGDTLAFGDMRVRLDGIDAPEHGQLCQNGAGHSYNCGQEALVALNGQIRGEEIRCEGTQHDRYQRLIATWWRGSETLDAWMVAHGWAVAYRRYSQEYVGEEDEAREGHKGMWVGAFDMPWDWRRSHSPVMCRRGSQWLALKRSRGA